MKKLLFVFAAVIAIGAASCKKCSTCNYTYSLAAKDSTVVFPETCGDKSEIEHYEDNVRAEAARNNGIVTCGSENQ